VFSRVKIIFPRLFASVFSVVDFVLRQGNLVCVMVLYQVCKVLLHGINRGNE
jgi:hypothetical protein